MGATQLTATTLVLSLAAWAGATAGHPPKSVGYEKRPVLGVPTHVITVDLRDPHVKVSGVLAAGFPGGDEPFGSMAKRSGAVAAVTGTFFSTRSRLPVGDIVIDGALRYFGGFGTALAFTPGNEPRLQAVPFGRHVDWQPFETVVSCGPRLVRGGEVSVAPRVEGFSDPRVLSRAWRVAVGVTAVPKLRLVAVTRPLTLTELAKIMRRLGCLEAINLDGGSSTAMYYRGRVVMAPGRRLVHLLTVHEGVPRSSRYAARPPEEAVPRHVSLRKQRAYAFYEQAVELKRRHRLAGAASALRLAVAWEPTNASYHLALGEALLVKHDSVNAAAAFARAGQLYVEKDRYEEAVAQLRRALSLSPLHVPARESLAEAHRKAGFARLAARERRIALMARLKLVDPATDWRHMHALTRQLTEPSHMLLSSLHDQHPRQRTPYQFTGQVRETLYRDRQLGVELHAPPGWSFVVPEGKETLELRSDSQPGYCTIKVLPAAGNVRLPQFVAACHAGDLSATLSERVEGGLGIRAYSEVRGQVVAGQEVVSGSVATQAGTRVVLVSITTRPGFTDRARTALSRLLGKLRLK